MKEHSLHSIPIDIGERMDGKPEDCSRLQRGPTRPCPNCLEGQLEYDGSLNLVCGQCGFTLSGGGYT